MSFFKLLPQLIYVSIVSGVHVSVLYHMITTQGYNHQHEKASLKATIINMKNNLIIEIIKKKKAYEVQCTKKNLSTIATENMILA